MQGFSMRSSASCSLSSRHKPLMLQPPLLRLSSGHVGSTCRGRIQLCTAATHGNSNPSPSAPPLPPELRTSERIKYPSVYQGNDYATSTPALDEDEPPVEESVFAAHTVEAQEQGRVATDYQQHGLSGGGNAPEQQYFQGIDGSTPAAILAQHRWIRPVATGVALILGATFVWSVIKVLRRYNDPKSKRKRTVDLNKAVVEGLDAYLPNNREGLTSGVVRGLKMRSGFSATEIFRKYLWYLLRERKFDEDAVTDLAVLRTALSMTDEEVAEALRERAQRIYEKYGNVMLETQGMTKAGIERKATCRALFSKLLYLAESEKILNQESTAAVNLSIPKIFGATDDDTDSLRIVSLYEVDLDTLEDQFDKGSP